MTDKGTVLATLLIILAASTVRSTGFQYAIPPVIGDPAKYKFSVTEQAQVKMAFAKPSLVMKSIILQDFKGIEKYADFECLPLHSQIWVVQKVCDRLAIRKEDRARFLMLHFSNLRSEKLARKVAEYKL